MIVTDIRYDFEPEFIVKGYISGRLMAAYDFDDHTLHVAPERRDEDGRLRWRYVLEHSGRVIFEGNDLTTGAYSEADPADAARTLLSFVTLRPGDVDDEYFDRYTPEQLEWRDSIHAEDLSAYAID